MAELEAIIKEYSSSKLKSIIETQSDAYSNNFIDYAKDELIRRGENLQFSREIENKLAKLSDGALCDIVEKNWENYHLEYLELARSEYLKRGLKNDSNDVSESVQTPEFYSEKRYPLLSNIAKVLSVIAWICGIVAVVLAFTAFEDDIIGIISLLVSAVLTVLLLLASSELIKVVIDIEENTRQ